MTAKSKRFEDKAVKLHRLLSILRRLDKRERFTPFSLAQKYGIAERTIFRDINDLNSSGFSIVFDKESGIYRFTDADFTLQDMDLSDNELMALLLGKR